jgi:hypothetical protein
MQRLVLLIALACSCKAAELFVRGDHHTLRTRGAHDPASSPAAPPILVIGIDGIDRAMLYDLLGTGELPNLYALVGGEQLSHAYLDDTFLATLPTTTMAAWASAFTGATPAQHGVTGNEYFIRETRTFACPAPVSIVSATPTLEIYNDDYLDKLIDAPTVYERMRARDPAVLVWVAMSHVYRGADQLILVKRSVLVAALEGYLTLALKGRKTTNRGVYAALDTGAIDAVVDRLAHGVVPDVLTVYLYGTDLYAHVAPEGPEVARRKYLREIVDPALGKLVRRLRERGFLDRAWVVVTSDHGHTEVLADRVHSLVARGVPSKVLTEAGFRVRPFKRRVAGAAFDAVFAYGGAMAYVYLADRSTCPRATDGCAWERPPRYREDVLAAAEVFHRANAVGAMRDTLDLILVREPRPYREIDLPFEVYLGDGKTMPLDAYLALHPRASYIAFVERLQDLAVGRHGERAGDVLLISHYGDRARPDERYYFAKECHSWHGSPSRTDSEIPLVVASPHRSRADIAALVRRVLGDRPYQEKLADLLLALRGS